MGLSTSKSKTTTDQTQNSTSNATQTPITPSWIQEGAQDYYGRIADFGEVNPQSLVAGASPLQQQAWRGAQNLGGYQAGLSQAAGMASTAGGMGANTYNAPNLGAAAQFSGAQLPGSQGYSAAQLGDPSTIAANMGAYKNPYEQDVVNRTLAGMDANAGQVRAQQAAQGARAGAFGGSRFGIREAQTEAELGRARGDAEAGLRAQGFREAASLGAQDASARNQFGLTQAGFNNEASRYGADMANQFGLTQAALQQQAGLANQGATNQFQLAQAGLTSDAGRFNAQQGDVAANRGLQAAQLLGGLSGQAGEGQRADLAAMTALGEQQRQIEQQQALAPLAQLQAEGSLYGMTPYEALIGRQMQGTESGTMTGTNVTKSSPSLFDSLIAGGQLAGTLFSDRRLKTKIKRVGTLNDGLGIYEFDYIWGGERQRGVMADEVATLRPHALGPTVGGYATVNYGAL